MFELEFFGCRGSSPACGDGFLKYGGNTTCIALYIENKLIIIDAGTGLASLQTALFDTKLYSDANIFFTHVHWDHIQGLPFFTPFFSKTSHFNFYGEKRGGESLISQIGRAMSPPVFPVTLDAFQAEIYSHDIFCGDTLQLQNVKIQTFRLCHPNICTGFRFEKDGKSVSIVTDYEHGLSEPIEAIRNSDILIYDAQYTDDEYQSKIGWGHSTWQQGCQLAQKSGAKQLLLTHHDPSRTDKQLDLMQQQAAEIFTNTLFATERMRIIV